jgi:hypothetical protein
MPLRYLVALAALILVACSPREYVYLYDCGGTISKFDLSSEQPLGKWPAEKIPGLAEVVPLPVMDGCALNDVLYDANSHTLFAVAPRNASQTADPTQPYSLLAIELPEVRLINHVELPGSATFPVLASKERELLVQYEVPREGDTNETWVARYDTALKPIGAPQQGSDFPQAVQVRPLPKEIPVMDEFTYPVYADR